MKKIAALGLAALVGASALAMTANTASAMPPGGPWNHHWDHHGHWGGGWGGGWGWGGPFVLGLGVGSLYGNPYYRDYDYGYGYGDDHVRWCEEHYRSYSPRTDTFFVRPGEPARCVAPFDRY